MFCISMAFLMKIIMALKYIYIYTIYILCILCMYIYSNVLCSSVLCSNVLCSSVLCSIVLHSNVLCSNVPMFYLFYVLVFYLLCSSVLMLYVLCSIKQSKDLENDHNSSLSLKPSLNLELLVNQFNNATPENRNKPEKIASSKNYDIDEMHTIEISHKNKLLSLLHINTFLLIKILMTFNISWVALKFF